MDKIGGGGMENGEYEGGAWRGEYVQTFCRLKYSLTFLILCMEL